MPINIVNINIDTPKSLLCGLMGYWNLDDGVTGTALDSYGVTNLTAYNVTQNVDAKISKGVYIDSSMTNQNLRHSMVGDYEVQPFYDQFTISLWVNITVLPSVMTYAGRCFEYSYGALPYQSHRILVQSSDDKAMFSVHNQNQTVYSTYSTNALSTGSFYHLVGVCYGAGIKPKLFVNNSSTECASTFTGHLYRPRSTSSCYIKLGSSSSGKDSINGVLDEVGVWDRALTDTEISNLYNGGTGLTYPF